MWDFCHFQFCWAFWSLDQERTFYNLPTISNALPNFTALDKTFAAVDKYLDWGQIFWQQLLLPLESKTPENQMIRRKLLCRNLSLCGLLVHWHTEWFIFKYLKRQITSSLEREENLLREKDLNLANALDTIKRIK